MRLSRYAALLVLLAGCAQTQPAFLSNGQAVERVTCALAIDGIASCLRTAGDICASRGFIIYDWNGQPWDKPYPGPDALQNDPGLAQNGLLIACRS